MVLLSEHQISYATLIFHLSLPIEWLEKSGSSGSHVLNWPLDSSLLSFNVPPKSQIVVKPTWIFGFFFLYPTVSEIHLQSLANCQMRPGFLTQWKFFSRVSFPLFSALLPSLISEKLNNCAMVFL